MADERATIVPMRYNRRQNEPVVYLAKGCDCRSQTMPNRYSARNSVGQVFYSRVMADPSRGTGAPKGFGRGLGSSAGAVDGRWPPSELVRQGGRGRSKPLPECRGFAGTWGVRCLKPWITKKNWSSGEASEVSRHKDRELGGGYHQSGFENWSKWSKQKPGKNIPGQPAPEKCSLEF